MVHTNPGAAHVVALPPASGSRIPTKSLAITLHRTVLHDEVSGQSSVGPSSSVGANNPVAIMDLCNASLPDIREHLKHWSVDKRSSYHIEGLQHVPQITNAIERLIHSGAFPQTERSYIVAKTDQAQSSLMKSLEGLGLVFRYHEHEDRVQWQFTVLGAGKLSMAHSICKPVALCAPRGNIAIENATSWELMCWLRQKDWTWERLPRTQKKRQRLPPYMDGSPRVWYTAQTTANVQYLVALVRASELFDVGVLCIHHWVSKPKEDYPMILKGLTDGHFDFDACAGLGALRPDQEQLTLPACASSLAQQHLCLEDALEASFLEEREDQRLGDDECAGDSDTGFTQDVSSAAPSTPPCSCSPPLAVGTPPQAVVWGDVEAPPDSPPPLPPPLAPLERLDAEAGPITAADQALPPVEAPALPSEQADQPPMAGTAVPLVDRPAPPASDDGRASLGRGARGREVHERSFDWGAFRLTFRPANAQRKYGGWQAFCQYHRLSAVTGCTKSASIRGPAEADVEQTLHMLMHWCALAPRFHRKRDHGAINPTFADTPLREILESRLSLLPPPPLLAQTDEELDAMEAPPGTPEPSERPAPKRKGKKRARETDEVAADVEVASNIEGGSPCAGSGASSSNTSSSSSSEGNASHSGSDASETGSSDTGSSSSQESSSSGSSGPQGSSSRGNSGGD